MNIDIGPVHDIPENGMREYDINGVCVLVCRHGDTVHAINGVCPHRGAQLGQGELNGSTVVCPWHEWAFDIETGCGITNPTSGVVQYQLFIENGNIVVTFPD